MDISDFIKQINTLGTVTSVRDHKLYRDIRANQKNVSGFKESGAKFSISTGLLYKIFQENPKAKTTELKDDYNITKRDRSAIRAILVALSTPHTHTDVKAISKNKSQKCEDSHIRDEEYIINLCDEVLGIKAKRQYTFDFLLGDVNDKGQKKKLPVDAFYEPLKLVVEYWEIQHFEDVPIYEKDTISGKRSVQRKIYDQRRQEVIPKHGLKLLIIPYTDFEHSNNSRLKRNPEKDIKIIQNLLAPYKK